MTDLPGDCGGNGGEMKFGAYARALRKDKDVSLRELAKKLGYSAAFICDVELGRRNPPVNSWARWAQIIGADYTEFETTAKQTKHRPCSDCPLKTKETP